MLETIQNFLQQTGFSMIGNDPKVLIMLLISFVLAYLAIVKKFEPLLLLPIAFGMLLTNLPGADMFHEILFAGGHIHWNLFGGAEITAEFLAELKAAGVNFTVLKDEAPSGAYMSELMGFTGDVQAMAAKLAKDVVATDCTTKRSMPTRSPSSKSSSVTPRQAAFVE